ncbi:prepilin-type N-terminal cleavage/methylation domain-containing protein [Pelagimonas varians]|uniref:prepilin-type N-terminal cleavage/methylation domain-containing protein n=1 Tax=Pelagimonas varians TaxID=696760 RepID=UPI0014728732|nr:prepilin-type N-terminal cleavage/methylation domain-containing protein [Pelagimonas varians]
MDIAVAPDTRSDAGFTLIELLVSVAIISVLAVGASLALGRQSAPHFRDLAQFRSSFETQSAMAVAGQQTLGLHITRQTIRSAALRNTGWQPTSKARDWRGPVTLSSRPVNGLPAPLPDIVFLPTGQSAPFRISFGSAAHCVSDGYAGLQCNTD